MAVSFFKMSALRIDLAHNLEAGFDNYRSALTGGYADFAAPLLEDGETAPDVGFHVELMKRAVIHQRQRLQTFDGGVVEQSHEDDKVRAELNRRQNAVEGKMRRVRDVCRGMFGREGVVRVGLKDEPPRRSVDLYQHGIGVKAKLKNPDLGLEPVLVIETGEGVESSSSQLAAQLEPELSELGELIAGRHWESRKSADVRSRRRQVLQDFDREIRAIVRTAQGMFRLAGRDDLAERFRPILRRVLRRLNKARAEEAEAENAAREDGTEAAEQAAGQESDQASETASSENPA